MDTKCVKQVRKVMTKNVCFLINMIFFFFHYSDLIVLK